MNTSGQLPLQANAEVDGSADQSMRFLTDALHQASFASPQRYTPSSVGYQTGPNVNQTFQLGPALPQTDRDVNTHRGSVSAAGNQFDSNGGASILQAARGVLETKLAFNSGQQHTMLPPLTTDEHMSLTAPPPSIDQQIYGSTVSQMEPSTHISASLWGLKQGNSRDDHVVGAAHQSAAPLRPWSTLPKNFGDASTKTRPGILDNGIFPAPELVPSNFPQNPTTSPVFQETSDNSPWGSIGDRRSNDKGSFASAFMPSSVTIRKKTSAPVLQSPLTGQMPVGFNPYQSQLSVSPEREYLPHPLQQQAGAQGLQSPYEVNETTTPNFSVDPHGSPRRSRFITSNTSPRRLGLQSFSLLRGASNSQSCEESCLHKEQVATLRNENEFLKRMLGQAEESMKLKSMDAAKKLEYYQTQMHLLTEESLRLQRVIAARDLAFKGTSSRTISPAKLERAATAPPAMSESFKKLTKQFTDEFLMLYRTLNCWSSRFLQFPNGDQVPQGLAEKLGEFLTSPELFGLILHEKTKQFAVSGFVARVFMKLIFVQDFVKKVADVFNAKQRNDPNFDATDDSLDTLISEEAESLAIQYHELIAPLLSRQHDATAIEGSRKGLIEVFKMAARISFKMNRTREIVFTMAFPDMGDPFLAHIMTNVENQTQSAQAELDLERANGKVKLASLPYIVLDEKNPNAAANQLRNRVVVYKASVLVI